MQLLPTQAMEAEVQPLIKQLQEKGFQDKANKLRFEIKNHMPLGQADHQIAILKGEMYNIISETSNTTH